MTVCASPACSSTSTQQLFVAQSQTVLPPPHSQAAATSCTKLMQQAARRRLRGKQGPSGQAGDGALAAELQAVDGLAALPADARRQHVHWTMVATHSDQDVQPAALTRQGFWQHLLRCYQEAYPVAESPTGCILEFALVASERHQNAPKWEDRCTHFHAACFTTEKHYWRKVRRVSAERFHIHLNAVAHDCYSTMYHYLRRATKRKPLYELDTQPYHSPRHPQGDALKALLAAGEAFHEVRSKKRRTTVDEGELQPQVRSHFGIFFQWVIGNGCRGAKGAVRLERDAVKELGKGRPQLLDFLRKNTHCLQELMEYCWRLNNADERLDRMDLPRIEILLRATSEPGAACANLLSQCALMYESILSHQHLDSIDFRHALYETFEHGRRKGNAMMLLGGKDTGKTTITQPAASIFRTMDTPQSDSFCPLQDARGFELYLWQDFRYNPGHPRKEDQGLRLDEGTWNRLLEGLPTRVGVAKSDSSRADFVFDENAPFIFTGPFKLVAYRHGRPDEKETEQLTCRVKYWEFARPGAPNPDRAFKPCPTCWARWLLLGEVAYRDRHGLACDDFLRRVRAVLGGTDAAGAHAAAPVGPGPGHADAGAPISTASTAPMLPTAPVAEPMADASAGAAEQSQWFHRLERLMDWRARGFLTDTEFAAAKARLGLPAE